MLTKNQNNKHTDNTDCRRLTQIFLLQKICENLSQIRAIRVLFICITWKSSVYTEAGKAIGFALEQTLRDAALTVFSP
jgi:hypothetical protein